MPRLALSLAIDCRTVYDEEGNVLINLLADVINGNYLYRQYFTLLVCGGGRSGLNIVSSSVRRCY